MWVGGGSIEFWQKKMFNQDEGKIECAVGNREICFLRGKESRDCFDFISDVGIAVFICLWLLVLPNSNNKMNHLFMCKFQPGLFSPRIKKGILIIRRQKSKLKFVSMFTFHFNHNSYLFYPFQS